MQDLSGLIGIFWPLELLIDFTDLFIRLLVIDFIIGMIFSSQLLFEFWLKKRFKNLSTKDFMKLYLILTFLWLLIVFRGLRMFIDNFILNNETFLPADYLEKPTIKLVEETGVNYCQSCKKETKEKVCDHCYEFCKIIVELREK